jgi:hypothetical protein
MRRVGWILLCVSLGFIKVAAAQGPAGAKPEPSAKFEQDAKAYHDAPPDQLVKPEHYRLPEPVDPPSLYAPGEPRPTWLPPGAYLTIHSGKHQHLSPRPCDCDRPAAVCIKPKVWKPTQALYQLHHELWHGVTDPCWLMDPDCCGMSCPHGKSFGLLDAAHWTHRRVGAARDRLAFWRRLGSSARGKAAQCNDDQGDCVAREADDEVIVEEGHDADGPVKREGMLRSILIKRK